MDEWPFRGEGVQGEYMIKFSKIYIMNEMEGGGYTNPHDGWMAIKTEAPRMSGEGVLYPPPFGNL
jgi:hypothetical protein